MVANALNSASMEERETVDCFLDDHEIRLEPRNTKNIVVEWRLDGSPAQSTLVKADKVKGLEEK